MSIVTTHQKHGNLLGSTPGAISMPCISFSRPAPMAARWRPTPMPLWQWANKVRMGFIPAGSTLVDAMAVVSTGLTATARVDLGFEYWTAWTAPKCPRTQPIL